MSLAVRRGTAFIACALFSFSASILSHAADKPKKPKLAVRAAPRMATSPAHIFFTAELQGGDDMEEFHCPALEWDWDDETKSTHESDCSPYQADTPIERRFTAEHLFAHEGTYDVKVTMSRADRTIASTRVLVTIRPGLGDLSGQR
jgi:hypothetical protein